LFDGVPTDDLRSVLRSMERRVFADGVDVLTEDNHVHEMYLVERGAADAFVTAPDGTQHHVNRLGPGGLLGEMSMLTGIEELYPPS
jgi:CRP-like cAMP-binding protein